MESRGSGSHSIVGTQIQARGPGPNPLARQGSFYSLTLDEVGSQLGDLGKPLGSMNLDELLRTVCAAEANNDHATEVVGYDRAESDVSWKGESGVRLSRDLSKKTVGEVWQSLDRTGTLGEMALEDLLVEAGVVGKKSWNFGAGTGDAMGVNHDIHGQWTNHTIPSIQAHPGQQAAYHETQVTGPSSPFVATLSDTTQTLRRKRVALDDVDHKSVERRQKRMIKNRESAARSRARKQAYTHELENKVMLLEEENERLRRLQELDNALPSIPQPQQPKYRLRRTSSAPI